MSYEHPYRGLKVVDVSQGYAGPYCAAMLARYGAEVCKIEPPDGDWIRHYGTPFGDHTAHSLVATVGKKSLALDLKAPEALEIVQRLAATADVFVESFRPGVASRLGIGYEAMRAANPRLLYLSVSGYGQTGPYVGHPATDKAMQAFSGLMSINHGPDGTPHGVDMVIIDAITGVHAFQALAAALHARATGETEGRHIDVSLMEAAAATLAPKIAERRLEPGTPRLPNAPSGNFPTSDGWVAVALIREAQFARLCTAIGCAELPRDPRFASFPARAENIAVLRPMLEGVFRRNPTAVWLERLRAADVICNPVLEFTDWLNDPQVQASGVAPERVHPDTGPVPFPKLPGALPVERANAPLPIPAIGEHSHEILASLGFSPDEIAGLAERKAVVLRR